jgi:hypothetical protein
LTGRTSTSDGYDVVDDGLEEVVVLLFVVQIYRFFDAAKDKEADFGAFVLTVDSSFDRLMRAKDIGVINYSPTIPRIWTLESVHSPNQMDFLGAPSFFRCRVGSFTAGIRGSDRIAPGLSPT